METIPFHPSATFSYHLRLRNMAPPENLDEKDILRGIYRSQGLYLLSTGAFLGNWPTYSGEKSGRKNMGYVSGNGDRHVPHINWLVQLWRQELSFKSCCSQRNLLQIRWGIPRSCSACFCVGKDPCVGFGGVSVGQKTHDELGSRANCHACVVSTHEVWILDGSLKFFFSWIGVCI